MTKRHFFDTAPGADTDARYEALIRAHAGLSEAQSHRLNARLVLLLGNAIEDDERFRQMLETARSYTD